ncbi:MAG: HIT domain-containing protein [Paracoccaceae bacterium]
MTFDYDDGNVFARILRGEIPCTPVLDTEHALAFPDLSPQAPVHLLVIPKGPYVSLDHFSRDATDAQIVGFWRAVAQVCEAAGVEDGFRAIANARDHAHQEVPHFHVHILGGRPLGPLLTPR